MGAIGFSYIGALYLLILFIPNIIWAVKKPEGYDPSGETPLLLILERVGQPAVTCTALIFRDTNPKPFSAWSAWLILSLICMALYIVYWVRYFAGKRKLKDFYRSLFCVPYPGASLPVIGFLLLGIYGKVIWIIISVIVLGIGHTGIHMQHMKKIKKSVSMSEVQ